MLDAKYCSAKGIPSKLEECTHKYLDHVADRYRGVPGTGVCGVVLLAGKLDAPTLTCEGVGSEEQPLRMVAPLHMRVGKAGLRELFERLGIVLPT